MTSAGPEPVVEVEPFFLSAPDGDLFLLDHRAPGSRPGRYLLIVPPFAEEMNKCRRMVSLLARQLATHGIGVLSIDLSGTGESWGDFSDARYETWLENLAAARNWLERRQATDISLLGIRFGALLATDFARRHPGCGKLVLWQPARSGQNVLAQFLRLRVAADMMAREGARTSVAQLTAELNDDRPVEVAGYELTPHLYKTISALQLPDLVPDQGQSIHWLQVSMLGQGTLTPADQRCVDELVQRGLPITSEAVTGEPFWNTTEVTICPPLLDATVDRLTH